MSVRQFIAIIALITAINLAGYAYGAAGKAAVFAGLGAVGLIGAVWYERHRGRVRDALASLDPQDRNAALVGLENTELRADVLADLDVTPPPVPLRGPQERFRYPAGSDRPLRWCAKGSFALAAFLALGSASDLFLGRERFRSAATPWYDTWGVILLFVGLGTLNWWFARGLGAVVSVTEESIELQRPGRRARQIRWSDVTNLRFGGIRRQLRLQGARQSLAVGDTIEDYGRLLNIALSRVPPSVRARAG